jgi:hypothetical protein
MADIHARQRFVEGISTRDERLFKRDHNQQSMMLDWPGQVVRSSSYYVERFGERLMLFAQLEETPE